MPDHLLDSITAHLGHYTPDETIAVIRDFLSELDEPHQQRFLSLVAHGPRPLIAEQMRLAEGDELLGAIQKLRDAIANDEYVEYGVGYDPDYGSHRGFGDDSWIDEMDNLFGATTSLFRAGRFGLAVDAYTALFRIFQLGEDGFHFTRPDPAAALRSDLDVMKQHLFVALARGQQQPAAVAIELSSEFRYYGANHYALLDAWQDREELITALVAELLDQARRPVPLHPTAYRLSHVADLLREYYRRHRTLADYETLCRDVGPQQGWPYEELVTRYRELASWDKVLVWADDGLARLPPQAAYRFMLQDARGEALLRLDRPDEALATLQLLFAQARTAPVYLKLREAACATGQWAALWPELAAELRGYVMAEARGTRYPDGAVSYSGSVFSVDTLLGFAYLLEGAWQDAVQLAAEVDMPIGRADEDLPRLVATGLLQMVQISRGPFGDPTLSDALANVPTLIRDYGGLLEPVARSDSWDVLLDGAVPLYERLVDRGIEGRSRPTYAEAAAYCKIIRAVRRLQGREAEFEQYYRGLLSAYARFSALKDELRTAIEGPGYKRTR